jgi:membrane protein YdbS with pleckstrin-like domain
LPGWIAIWVAELVWWLLASDSVPGWHAVALAATVGIGVAHLIVMPQWRYRVHRWEATPHVVYTQAGWFDQQRRIAPLSRIQTVDTERGPLEQLFGLSNVTVTTASAAGPLKVHGLDRDTAQRLVDELASTADVLQGDGT